MFLYDDHRVYIFRIDDDDDEMDWVVLRLSKVKIQLELYNRQTKKNSIKKYSIWNNFFCFDLDFSLSLSFAISLYVFRIIDDNYPCLIIIQTAT